MRVPIVMEIPIDVREMVTCPLKQDGVGKSFGMTYPFVWGLDGTWFGGCERKCPVRKPKQTPLESESGQFVGMTCPFGAFRSGERKCPCRKEAATIPKQAGHDEVAKGSRMSCPIVRELNSLDCAAFRNSRGSRCPCRKEAVTTPKQTPMDSASGSEQSEIAKSSRKSCPFDCAAFRNSGGSRCPCRKEAATTPKQTPMDSGSVSDQDEVAKSSRKSCPFDCAAFRNSGGTRCPCRKEAATTPKQTPPESGSVSVQDQVANSFGITCPIMQGLKVVDMFRSFEGSKCPCKEDPVTKPKETGSVSGQEGVAKRSEQDEAAKSSQVACPIKFRNCKARKCPCQKETRENVSVSNEDGITVALDVHNYKPSELIVKVIDNFIVIEGNAEEQEVDGGSVSRQFVRKINVPEHCNKDEMVHSTSPEGILTVSIPAKKRPTERIVTIQKLDKPTNSTVEPNTQEEIEIPVNIEK